MRANREEAISAAPYLRAAFFYFILVFGAGFVLGPVRILLLVPRTGVRTAELLEIPVMIAIIVFAARWVVRRFNLPACFGSRIRIGVLALSFLAAAELGVAVGLQGLSFSEYIATRDPVSGTFYLFALGIFAFMPTLVQRQTPPL